MIKRYFIATGAIFCAMFQFAAASPPRLHPDTTPVAVTWMGVTLGEPEADVLSTNGETGFMNPEPAIGPMTSIAYNIEGASGLLDVSFHSGRVASIGIRRSTMDGSAPSASDPHGITLAMSQSEVTAKLGKGELSSAYGRDTLQYKEKNGLTWRYSFMNNVMQYIDVTMPDAAIDAMPAAPAFALHSGSSFEDALINGAADESSGAANERDYLLEQHCPSGHWWETQQALVTHNDRRYDLLTLSCANGTTKNLYLDITSFFGKV